MTLNRIVPGFSDIDLDWDLVHVTTYLRYFDAEFYRNYPHFDSRADLAHLTPDQAAVHFVTQGWKEQRAYSSVLHAFCEPEFYIDAYPELRLRTAPDALRHWMYHGVVEGRDPNRVTRQLRETVFHAFNMAKVGSIAVVNAIHRADPAAFVVHAHSSVDFARTYPDCFWSYPELIARSPTPKRFIAGVRDPFDRVLAGYVEHGALLMAGGRPSGGPDALRRAVDEMVAGLPYLVSWFDHGFYCGIDAYAHPFDPAVGFSVCGQGAQQAFVYRLSHLSGLATPMGEFLGLDVRIRKEHTVEEKGPEVAAFAGMLRREVRFPADLVERVVSSRFVRHFFSAEEIAALRERWTE